MFFQPPDEEPPPSTLTTQSSSSNTRRRRKKKFPHKKKQKKDAWKKRPLRLASTMSSWAENFTHAATWQLQHQIAYWKSRAKALEYENRILHDIIRKNCINSHVNAVELESRPDNEEEHGEDEEDAEEENLEVSEEFIEFLTANAKYKEEAKRERERLKAKLEAEEVDTVKQMEAGPPEKQVNSEETMRELYGDNWERIAALEMNLHSQFISHTDKEKPMYWPNIPFNFNFGK